MVRIASSICAEFRRRICLFRTACESSKNNHPTTRKIRNFLIEKQRAYQPPKALVASACLLPFGNGERTLVAPRCLTLGRRPLRAIGGGIPSPPPDIGGGGGIPSPPPDMGGGGGGVGPPVNTHEPSSTTADGSKLAASSSVHPALSPPPDITGGSSGGGIPSPPPDITGG